MWLSLLPVTELCECNYSTYIYSTRLMTVFCCWVSRYTSKLVQVLQSERERERERDLVLRCHLAHNIFL